LLLSSFLADEGPDSTSSYYPVQAEGEMEESRFILSVYSCWSVSRSLANDLSSSPSLREKKGEKTVKKKSRKCSGSFFSCFYLFSKVKSYPRGVTLPTGWRQGKYIFKALATIFGDQSGDLFLRYSRAISLTQILAKQTV